MRKTVGMMCQFASPSQLSDVYEPITPGMAEAVKPITLITQRAPLVDRSARWGTRPIQPAGPVPSGTAIVALPRTVPTLSFARPAWLRSVASS